MILLLIVLIVIVLYLLSLRPNTGRKELMRSFEEYYIAHRGLFDNASDHPENSLPAFQLAVENGYGIELDVQLTSDGQMVVFHDNNLKRMCGKNKMLTQCTLEELHKLHLKNSQETIPLFSDVLQIVDGKVPMIVEIKNAGDYIKTAQMLSEMMKNYHGVYCVESFQPKVVAWYRKNHPEVIRGQLSMHYIKEKKKGPYIQKFVLTNLMLNFYTKPDFIAYDYNYRNQFSYRLCRILYSVENVAWTIQSEEQLEEARKVFQVFIFDSFRPAVKEE